MDEELDLVVFEDDEGNEITMEVLDYFFYEGKEYALLAEVDEDGECGCDECDEEHQRDAYIMEVVDVGDDQEEFVPVAEELADKLVEIVQNGPFRGRRRRRGGMTDASQRRREPEGRRRVSPPFSIRRRMNAFISRSTTSFPRYRAAESSTYGQIARVLCRPQHAI